MVIASTPYAVYPLALVALLPLFITTATSGVRGAAFLGWIAGAVAYGVGFRWLVPTVQRLQDTGPFAAAGLFGCFIAYHALQWGAAAAGTSWLTAVDRRSPRRGSAVVMAAAVAAWWVLCEWAFPQAIPWALGSALGPAPSLRQAAEVGGAYGLTFALVLVNALLTQTALRWRRGERGVMVPAAWAMAVAIVLASYGALWLRLAADGNDATLEVALVQGGIGGGVDDVAAANAQAWDVYADLTRRIDPGGVDLIVWPESVLRVYLRENPPFQERLTALLAELDRPLLLGALDRPHDGAGEMNSAYLVAPHDGGASQVYHKHALVPFAEYVPQSRWLPGVRSWRTTGAFVAGQTPGVLRLDTAARRDRSVSRGTVELAASICFEAIIPVWFNPSVRHGAELLVNVTDDTWLGGSIAPAQHLEMTRLRAVETRRWLLRASNSGISAVIDPTGEFVASLPFGEVQVLRQQVGLSRSLTPYVRWGNWVPFVCAALVLTACVRRAVRAAGAPP